MSSKLTIEPSEQRQFVASVFGESKITLQQCNYLCSAVFTVNS